MNDKLIIYICIFLGSVFISSVSQVMLKKSAMNKYSSKIKEYLNPIVIIAYGLFFSCSLITLVAYKNIPISLGPILESSGYVFVSALGYIFLKERISKKKLIGMIIIITGIIVFSL